MPEDHTIMGIRDRGISLERTLELIASDARHGMNFCMAESAAHQAQASRESSKETQLLNRMVAFFFPLATFAAIMGMNPPHEVLGSGSIWTILILGIFAGWLLQKKHCQQNNLSSNSKLKLHVAAPRYPFLRKGPPPLKSKNSQQKDVNSPQQNWK